MDDDDLYTDLYTVSTVLRGISRSGNGVEMKRLFCEVMIKMLKNEKSFKIMLTEIMS